MTKMIISEKDMDGKTIAVRSAEITANNFSKSAPFIGTDGKFADITAETAFAAGRTAALYGKTACMGCGETEDTPLLAAAFAAGVSSLSGKIISVGKVPENVLRYAAGQIKSDSAFYIGGYIRPWAGDGLPSDERLRRRIESETENTNLSDRTYSGDIYLYNDIYKSYNNHIDKLIVSDISGIFADIYTSDRCMYKLCRSFTARHGADDRSHPRIAFNISGDGSRVSAYTDETGYVFHERLAMMCICSRHKKRKTAAADSRLPSAADRIAPVLRFDYAPDHGSMTETEREADRKARSAAAEQLSSYDGLAIIAEVLNYLAEEKITLGEALKRLPRYSSAAHIVPVKTSTAEVMKRLGIRNCGGSLPAVGGSADVRPMRTGNGVRIYAESVIPEAAAEICGFYENLINEK